MITSIRCVLALVATVLTQIPFARAADQVDLLLDLAMDVSRGMLVWPLRGSDRLEHH